MKEFIYYIPALRTAPSEAALKEHGIMQCIGSGHRARGCDSGPDSTGGMIVAGPGESVIGFHPHRQTWSKAGNIWIGWENGQLPGPNELQRDELVEGHRITMGDKAEWLVPIVRSNARGTALPQSFLLNEAGEWSRRPMQVYQDLAGAAEKLWKWCVAEMLRHAGPSGENGQDDVEGPTSPQLADLVCRALAVNYKVGRWEVSILKLLDDRIIWTASKAIVDWPGLVEMAAAKAEESEGKGEASASDTLHIGAGAKDSSQPTSPALQT